MLKGEKMETFVALVGTLTTAEVLLLYISIKFLIVDHDPKPAIVMLVHIAAVIIWVFEYSNPDISAFAFGTWLLTIMKVLFMVVKSDPY